MKNKLIFIGLVVGMMATAYATFKALEGADDIFAVSFDEEDDASF